nr:hypothetical protein [Tanacetum cinerariifolium]
MKASIENPYEDVDMLMDDDDEDDDEGEDDGDDWEVDDGWLMAPVTPLDAGQPFSEVVSSVAVHHKEIGGLCVRIKNLEHAHSVMVRKIGDVSDAQLDDEIAIGEIQSKVTTLEGQVRVLASQQEQTMTKVGEVEYHVLEMQDKVNNNPCGQVDGLREDVDRLLGLKDRV